MTRYCLLLLLIAGLPGCNRQEPRTNKFADDSIRKIADLKDRRATDSLYAYFDNEEARYREEAAMAFGSVQDSTAVDRLHRLLMADPDAAVRKAAAFALGQTPASTSASVLLEASRSEKDTSVLNMIFESYGKVTRAWTNIKTPNEHGTEGIAWSLYRSGLNNTAPPSANEIAVSFLASHHTESTRLAAAHFVARSGKELAPFFSAIARSAANDASVDVRMASAYALRKIPTDSSFIALENIIKSNDDYKVRINAIRALGGAFPFQKTKDHLLRALNDKNINVGIAASEVVRDRCTEDFWMELANRVGDIQHWRIQANLYHAILKVKDNESIVAEVKTRYSSSADPYQRAALLTALQEDIDAYEFLAGQLSADTPVIRSSAAAALVAIDRNKNFPIAWRTRFATIYSGAIKSRDAAVIGTVASALADTTLGYRSVIKDYGFLLEARQSLSLPKDNEALQPLEEAIAYFEGKKAEAVRNEFNHPIDWNLVTALPADQRAIITTTKGTITIRLLVEEAPGSVANFVSLARSGYFDGKFFHRVVPNFVIQAGCNRGDGWGSEAYSIRSEFSQRRYKTGSVGMASAGKDTEGTQWFITHSPTPHLDGRYTIFAEVENGMYAVHATKVGDLILKVEIPDVKDKQMK